MKVELRQVEEAAKELYIRALKQLPPDIKEGFARHGISQLLRCSEERFFP